MVRMDFINECRGRANKNRLGRIHVEDGNLSITNKDQLQSFSIDSSCYVDGSVIGTVYVKKLGASFVKNNLDFADKKVSVQAGVTINGDVLEDVYVNLGEYGVERSNNEITKSMSDITAYDLLYPNLDQKYVSGIDYSSGVVTIADLYLDVCQQLGVTPTTLEFTNSNIEIGDNPFVNGEKNRTVLQTIAKIACAFVDIDNDTGKIELRFLNPNREDVDYVFYKNDYVSVEGGQVVCGPVNCLIIKNSRVDSENVVIKDEDSILLNGEHSITISEDYILYNSLMRQEAIDLIWNKVKGLKYVDCKLTTYYGKPFLKLGNKIRIYTGENEYFDTFVLQHQFTYDGTFSSVISSKALTKQEVKIKQDISLKEKLLNTQIEVNKQKQTITLLVDSVDESNEKVSKFEQDIDGMKTTVLNTVSRDEFHFNTDLVNDSIDFLRQQQTIFEQSSKELKASITDIENNGVQTLKNTMVTVDITGIKVAVNTDSFSSLLNNKGIFLYKYNSEIGRFTPDLTELDNLTVRNYLVAGYHRTEKYTNSKGKKRTGYFWVGD